MGTELTSKIRSWKGSAVLHSPFVPDCSENTETNQPGLQDQGSNPPVTWGDSQSALPDTEDDGFAVAKGMQQPSRD